MTAYVLELLLEKCAACLLQVIINPFIRANHLCTAPTISTFNSSSDSTMISISTLAINAQCWNYEQRIHLTPASLFRVIHSLIKRNQPSVESHGSSQQCIDCSSHQTRSTTRALQTNLRKTTFCQMTFALRHTDKANGHPNQHTRSCSTSANAS